MRMIQVSLIAFPFQLSDLVPLTSPLMSARVQLGLRAPHYGGCLIEQLSIVGIKR